MRTFELQSLEHSFSRLVTQCLIDDVLLKSVQFMSEVFPLLLGAFSVIMKEPELSFSFAEAEFCIVFSFSILSAWILSGVSFIAC